MSCHFIGYPEKSKGFCFYYPDIHTKFVEMRHAVFLEDEMMRGSMVARMDENGTDIYSTVCSTEQI